MNYLIISAGLRNHLSLHRFPEYLEELWGYCFHRLVHTTTLRALSTLDKTAEVVQNLFSLLFCFFLSQIIY